MHSTKEKRSPFIERWAKAEDVNSKLGMITVILSLMCIFLTGVLGYMATRPKPIYVIPTMEAGIVYPKGLPDSAVSAFAASWILDWTNFTPVTVNDAYKRAQRLMSPGLLSKTMVRLNKDLEEVKNNNISSLFSLDQDPKVQREGSRYEASISGQKVMYVGKENITTEKMMYRIFLKKINPTDTNPQGLIIEDVDQEVIKI
jgi:hypothetical protein